MDPAPVHGPREQAAAEAGPVAAVSDDARGRRPRPGDAAPVALSRCRKVDLWSVLKIVALLLPRRRSCC